MRSDPIPCLVQKRGNSLGITLAKRVRDQLTWREGDFVAVRVCGKQVIMERIALEKAAILPAREEPDYADSLLGR
jgi:antitoxin component of MazEF toxin-antitoxin module